MTQEISLDRPIALPSWIPANAMVYVAHVESGRSIRSLAREAGVHASTILRKVRRFEARRDDLLIDLALLRLGRLVERPKSGSGKVGNAKGMEAAQFVEETFVDDAELRKSAPRILRRLNEAGACLAIARDMDNAVIVREVETGQTIRTAVLDRHVAEAMALKDWIVLASDGRVARYRITAAGRMALKRFLAEDEAVRVGLGEAADPYSEQHKDWVERSNPDKGHKKRGIRYNAAESPLSALARRKDKDGKPFLSPELVAAGERLREDFELAQMGPRVAQNWDKFLSGGGREAMAGGTFIGGSGNARERVLTALKDLGPGLGDVVLRCCCFLEGMEAVERRMGWSARSGKIVLRIALTRLKSHYDEENGNWSPLIG